MRNGGCFRELGYGVHHVTPKVINDYIYRVARYVNSDYKARMIQTKPRDALRHGNLKEALINYTLNAADDGMLADLSVRKAARELGVSPGAAYRHFPDKNALLQCVAERGFDSLATAFEHTVPFDSTAKDAADARKRFAALAMAYVSFAGAHRELWRLMFGPFGLGPSGASDRPSTYDWLGKCLSELANCDIIAPPRPEHQFFAWSAIHGMSDLQGSPALRAQPIAASVERQCELIICALAAQS
ncbi:TetR/AcrR family transcriptional regulator [uncultured Tateyamaria sp.]|uniref:TetR/AcrR family transcriptional regulator n=1 Tax=uncultured Tateyamaria sp. TaxID=455651 RepID=UPI00262D5DD4|nr:TetR/AcrR family transcriptional regulator [uncultured Tateyamaria sp.]